MRSEAVSGLINALHQEKEEAQAQAQVYLNGIKDNASVSWVETRNRIFDEIKRRISTDVQKRFDDEFGVNASEPNYQLINTTSQRAFEFVLQNVRRYPSILRVEHDILEYRGGLDIQTAEIVDRYIDTFYRVMTDKYRDMMEVYETESGIRSIRLFPPMHESQIGQQEDCDGPYLQYGAEEN